MAQIIALASNNGSGSERGDGLLGLIALSLSLSGKYYSGITEGMGIFQVKTYQLKNMNQKLTLDRQTFASPCYQAKQNKV